MTFSKAQLKKLKSTIAGATASVFAFTTVSVPVVEANFWQDRQKAARTVADPSSADAGTAESRSLYAGMFKGANPMLLDEKAVDGVAAGARDLVTKGLADLVTPRTTDQKPLPAWMRTLVTPFGEIDDFHVTGSLRNAAAWSFDKSADPVIVLIQDVHNVPEAQLNISKIMESYQTRAGLSVVGLEGATGGLLTDKFRAMNAPEALRWASDFLINERVLSGAEYFGLNAPRSATLWGIENEGAYLANVEAYKQTVALRPDVAAFEASANGALAALQEKVYSADLKTFERQRSLYADEKISLSDYVESIAAGPALRAGVNPNAYPNIALFRKAILLEKTIDFKKVEAERTEFLQALTARLSKDDLTRLVALSMEFRLHHVGFGDYYKALSTAAARVKVDLSNTPELKKYVSYALLTDGIARTSFLNEIGRLEDSVTEGLATSTAQKEAARLSRDNVLLHKLLHHNLTFHDWSAFLKRVAELRAFDARLAAAGQKNGVPVAKAEFGFPLSPYEAFYTSAQARNEHFVQNLFDRLRASGARSAVLVAGGFHTEGLRDLLTQKGVGHVVVTPRLTKVDKDDNYLDVFVRDHTPLEKMMLGEKLFIRNTLGLAENAPAGFAGVHDSVTRGLSVLAFAAVLALGAATPREAVAAANSDAAQRALANAPVPMSVTGVRDETVNLTAGNAPLSISFAAADSPAVAAPGRLNAGTAGGLSVSVAGGPTTVAAAGWWDTFQKWIDDLRGAGKKPAAGAATPRFQDFLYQTSPGVEAQRILNDDAVRALLIGIPRNSLPAFYDLLKKDAFLNATNLPPAFAVVQARIWQVFAEGPVRFGSKDLGATPRHPVMDEVQKSLLRSAEQNARNPRYSITSRLDTPDNTLFEAQRILADPALLEMLNKLTPEQIDAVATAPGNGAFIGSPRRQLYGTALGEIIDRVSYLFDNGPFARGGLDARQRLEVVQLVEKKLAEAAKTAAAGRAKTGAVTPVVESVGAPFRDHLLRTSPDIETHRVLTSNKVLGLANDLSIREVETLAALAREGKFLSTRKFDGTTLGDFQANILAGFLRGPLAVTRPDGVQGLSETGFGVLRQAEAELAAAADKVLRMPRYHLGSRLYDDSPFTVDAQRVLADGRLQDLLNGMDAVAVDLLAEAKGDGLLLTDPRTAATSLGPVAQRVIALFNEGAFGTRGHESARNPKPLQIIELRLATAARAAQNARNQPPSTPGRGTPRALLTTLLVGPLAFLPASGAWAADGALRASTDWLSFIGVTVSVAALALGGLLVLAYLSVSPKMPAPFQKFGNAVLNLLNLRRRTSATPTATPAVPAMTLPELIQRIDGLSNPVLGALKANLEAGVVSTPEALAAVSVLLDAGQASLFAKWDAPGTHDDSKRGFLAQVAKMNAEYPGGLTTYAANARVLLEKSARGDNPFKGKTPNAPPMTNLTGRMDEVERYQTAALPSANNLAFVLMAGGMGERLGYNGIKISIPLDLVTETTYMGWYIRHILALQEASNRKTGESKKIPLFIMTSEENHDVTMAFLAEHDYFGMDKEQIIVRQQPLVPAVQNNNADFALDADDPYRLQGKPHGHGDVHMLLHHNGIVKEWKREGRSHVVFIQDTNGQVFNGLLAAVGVSMEKDLDVNFLTVDREAGEKTGSITTLVGADQSAVTGNVEYNEIDPLLRETSGRGDVADPKTGKSPFPANLNVLIFKTGTYNEILERTNGIVGEFINPKYADKEKTKFPAARLETMMQTIAFEYQGHGKVAATNFDKRDVFSPVKNNMKTGAENPAKGTYPDAMPTGEADFYKYGRRLLSLAGGLVNVEGKTAQIHGVPYQAGAKVVLYPSFAETIADVKAKVRGTVTVTDRSTLVLDGANITIEGLALDGALIVHAVPGASLAIRGLELRAPARSSDGVYSEVGLADPEVPDYLRIRGYELFPYRDAARVDLTEPGQYVLDRDGNLFRDGALVRNVNPDAASAESLAGKISAQSKLSIDAVRDYLSRGPSAGAAAEATFIEGHLAGAMHDFVRSALVNSGVKLNGDMSAVASAVVEEIDAYRDDQGLSFAAAVARFGAENLKQGRPEVARALAADLAVSLPTEADRAPFRHLVKMLDARSQLAPRLEGLKKAYDIRGLTGGKDRLMTPEFVYAAAYTDGLALAKEFPKDTPAVMITGDQRWSTPALRQAAIDGYTAAGAHVYFSNERVSTPAANVVPRLGAFSVEGRPVLFHRVLQISASHDPWLGDASKNGMKMNGRKDFHLRSMEGPQVAAMLEGMFSAEAGRAPDPAKRGRATEIHLLPAYTEFVARRFVGAVEQYGLERADLEKLVFVTDGGQGVMDDVTPGVVDGINRALRDRFNDPAFSLAFDSVHPASVRGPDGTVEHPADPVEAGHFADHLKTEMDRVRAAHPGKIVVFAVLDGDGDRSGLMGADGKVLSSTQQAFLYFNRLLADRPADRERLRLDIRMGQEILELVGQVTPANQSMIDPGWSKQRRVLLQANAPGGIEGSYHTFVRISDDANTEPMDDGLVFSLDQALYELKLAREGTSSTELLGGRSWYPEMSEFRPKFIEAVVDDRYAVMPNITQAIIASVKSEFAAEKANVVVVESREEKGAARIQIYDDAGNFLGWVLMRTSNTNPVLSMKGQGRDAATLARLKRILKNALENEQFTGRFNQAEIDKGLGTVVPGSQGGFAQVSLLTLLASGLGAVVLALTGAPGVLVGFALVPGLLAAGMEAVRWWASGRGAPGRKPIAATPEREILEAAGVRRALTTPKVSVSPEMDKRQLQGGYKQDGTGVPVGAADDGSRARGENAGNQGYYAQGGREAFLKVYRDMRNFFENRAARHGGNPVRLVIKPGIGGQHTPFQGLASVFEVVDPSSGKIVGEYELGKDFAASLEAAVKDLRIGWDQVAVIPSSKSGSTDETMMIFVELLSVLIEKQSSKAFADLFLKTLHDLNFPDGANERPGKDLFKVDVKEDGFATTSLVELLSHRASQAGLDVNVRDVLGKVLGNMFFETTDRPEQSRLSAFIRNSGLDRDLGADAPGFGAMFDNVGGRWTADLHMLTFLAYHRLDAEAYWTARDAGIAEVVAGTHKAVEIGNTIVDLGIADIALVVPNDLYWYAKSIEQNFNESLWPADAVNERRTPNLVAVRASDWEAQRANYEGRSDVMIIDAVTKDVPPITEENQIYLGAVLNRAAGRAALPGMFAQLATTFYGITETVGDRLIARALLRAGYTANDVDMNNLDNPATKIVVDHLYLRQPYVELGKGLLEARLKGIQKEEASNPGALERAQSKIDAQAEAGDVVHNLPGLEVPADRSAPALAGIIRTAVETARAEGRKPLFFLYADGAEFESMRDALIAMGYPWVIQGTGDQHISYQQVLAQPAYYLPIFVSLVSATPQAGRPAIGFAKGYLNNVSPNMVRHFFAEASFEALTSLRADVGGRGLLLTLKDTAENRDALLAGATLAARATATGNFPVRALRSPNANEAPLNAAGAWLSARLTAFGRVPASAVSANDLVTALTALFGVQIHSLGRSVLPTADDAARFLGALAEQNPDARGRDLVATAVQERFAAFRPPQFLPEASDKKTTVFYLDARATDEMIERVDRAVVAAAEAKDGGRVVVLLEPGVESRLSGEMATRPSSRRVTRATLALDGADGLGPVENGVRSLQMASVANRFGFALDNAVVVAPAASLTPIVLPGNSSNNYVNRYVGDGVTVPVSTRFTETLRDVLSKPAPIQTPAARQGGFARVSLLTMIASALGVVAVVVTGTASPAILAVAALPGAVALGLEIRRSVAVQRLIQGLTLYGRLGTLPDGRPSMDAVKAARRLFTGRETGSASTELLVWLAGGALFAAVSLAIGLAPTFFLAGFGLTLFSGRPTMSGRTLSLALVAAGAALFGLPTGAEAAGLFGIPGVAENSPLPWLFGMGGIVLGVAARGVGGDAVELRARDSLKAVDGLLPVARLSEILPDQWTPAKPENQADLQAGLVQFYSAFGGAWLGFTGRAYDALSPAEKSRIDVAFLNDADIRRMVSAFNALSRRSPEEARGAFGVYANRVLRALARNATAKSARPDASLLRALGLFLLAQRAELFGTASTEREANAVAVLTRLATLPRPSERNDMTVESSHWDLVPRPSGNTPDIAFVEVDTQDDAGLVRSVISSLHNGAVILAVATDPEAAAQRLARAKETILRDHKQGVLETLRRPDHRHALDSWQDLTRRVVSRSTPGMLDEQGRYSVAGLYKAVPELSKTMGFAPGLFSGENIKYRMSILTGDKTLAHWNQLGVPEIGDLVQFLILEGPKIVRMSLSITQEMEAIHVLSTNA